MRTPSVHADLRVTRGTDRMRVRASGRLVTVSLENPLTALRLWRSGLPELSPLIEALGRVGLELEVRLLRFRVMRPGKERP